MAQFPVIRLTVQVKFIGQYVRHRKWWVVSGVAVNDTFTGLWKAHSLTPKNSQLFSESFP